MCKTLQNQNSVDNLLNYRVGFRAATSLTLQRYLDIDSALILFHDLPQPTTIEKEVDYVASVQMRR